MRRLKVFSILSLPLLLACPRESSSDRATPTQARASAAPETPTAKTPTPDTPKTPATPSRADAVAPTTLTEAAIVASDRGLLLVDIATGTAQTIAPHPIRACLADPAARAIWFLAREGGTTSLQAYDLDANEAKPIIGRVPDETDAIAVSSWRGGQIQSASISEFEVGLLLDVRSTPKVQRFVGCMSDAFDCFSDVDTETLRPELETVAGRIDQAKIDDPGAAKRLGDRSAGSLPRSIPEAMPRIEIPTSACEADPESCGSARALPGTDLQLVVIANSRGDLYHESVALYDPKAKRFAPLSDPRKTSESADVEPAEITRLWVAPSGLAYAYDDHVIHLQRGPIHEGGRACGFTTGGELVASLGAT